MSVKGAVKAAQAGAAAIVVSNHGDASWTRALLRPKSCRKSRLLWAARSKSLLTAGSVPALMFSKALALGADAVLIARPFVNAVYGGGKEGVRCLVDKLGAELKDTMEMCGAATLREITGEMIRR